MDALDAGNPNIITTTWSWLQVLANVAVFAVVAVSSLYAYIRARVTPPKANVSVSDDHGLVTELATKALVFFERSAIALEIIAKSIQTRDKEEEIDRLVEERIRLSRVDEDARKRKPGV